MFSTFCFGEAEEADVGGGAGAVAGAAVGGQVRAVSGAGGQQEGAAG